MAVDLSLAFLPERFRALRWIVDPWSF